MHNKVNVLVTGGCGYIGAHFVKKYRNKVNIIVIDNLSNGEQKFEDVKYYDCDLVNKADVKRVFEENKINFVVHFAGYKHVNESMKNPEKYSDNIVGSINLINLSSEYKVEKFIFSSSCAIYGNWHKPIIELTRKQPINIYGWTKLKVEEYLEWMREVKNFNYISLRYFNVAGDLINHKEKFISNIFPVLKDCYKNNKTFKIYGNDYNTFDGTCVRDYIHVIDLLDAHYKALNNNYIGAINLGTNTGTSVLNIYNEWNKIFKTDAEIVGRREGDPDFLVSSNRLAIDILDWNCRYNIKDIVRSYR